MTDLRPTISWATGALIDALLSRLHTSVTPCANGPSLRELRDDPSRAPCAVRGALSCVLWVRRCSGNSPRSRSLRRGRLVSPCSSCGEYAMQLALNSTPRSIAPDTNDRCPAGPVTPAAEWRPMRNHDPRRSSLSCLSTGRLRSITRQLPRGEKPEAMDETVRHRWRLLRAANPRKAHHLPAGRSERGDLVALAWREPF